MSPDSQENYLYLFDLDGTLLDSSIAIRNCLNKVRKGAGFAELPTNLIKQKIGLPANYLFQDLNLQDSELFHLVSEFRNCFKDASTNESKIFEGVCEYLRKIIDYGFFTCTATTRPTAMIEKQLQDLGISSLFTAIQGTDNFPPKPDPAVIKQSIMKFKTKKVYMFGDRTEDMIAARAAGIVAIGISQGAHTELELQEAGAHLTFKNFKQLPDPMDLNKFFN